jgi:hypothetical protein
VPADPAEQQQAEAQQQSKKKDKGDDTDDGSVDAALGLINSGPVQLKSDLERPVTSGGMETTIDGPVPGTPN